MSFEDAVAGHNDRERSRLSAAEAEREKRVTNRANVVEVIQDFITYCEKRGLPPQPVVYEAPGKDWRGRSKSSTVSTGLHGWIIVDKYPLDEWRPLAVLDNCTLTEVGRRKDGRLEVSCTHGWRGERCYSYQDCLSRTLSGEEQSAANWLHGLANGYEVDADGTIHHLHGRSPYAYPQHSWAPTVMLFSSGSHHRWAPLVDILAYLVRTGRPCEEYPDLGYS